MNWWNGKDEGPGEQTATQEAKIRQRFRVRPYENKWLLEELIWNGGYYQKETYTRAYGGGGEYAWRQTESYLPIEQFASELEAKARMDYLIANRITNNSPIPGWRTAQERPPD